MAIENEPGGDSELPEVLEEAFARGAAEADPAEVAAADDRLRELLDKVAEPREEPLSVTEAGPDLRAAPASVVRTGRAVGLSADGLRVAIRGLDEPVLAALEPGLSRDLLRGAVERGERVVVEQVGEEAPVVVGLLQTQTAEALVLKAKKIHIEGEQEVLIRSGRGAMRIRQDGDVELVGSRISAMSRGLFRLVGRVLRLN